MTRSIFEPTQPVNTKLCPSCYTYINVAATRCPNCTSELYPIDKDIQYPMYDYPVYELSEEQRKEMAENSITLEKSMRRDSINMYKHLLTIFFGPIVLLSLLFLLYIFN